MHDSASQEEPGRPARVCLLSQRRAFRDFFRCASYEFEDVVCASDDVDLLAPPAYSFFPAGIKVANRLARHCGIACLNPGVSSVAVPADYDLFFACGLVARDLLLLNAVHDWRRRCRTAVCFLAELWAGEIGKWARHLRLLSRFDHVFTSCQGSVEPLARAIGRPCHYLPPATDALRFAPAAPDAPRCVDVYGFGRRTPAVHAQLLALAAERRIFYLYDTYATNRINWVVEDHREHRLLTAAIAQRSRYFIVNPAKMDRRVETSGQSEIGYRYFEGAAAGAVLLGTVPQARAFGEQFDWPDAVVAVPTGDRGVERLFAQLDADPGRVQAIRAANVRHSLRRHDWCHRWRTILETIGMAPRPPLSARVECLNRAAAAFDPQPGGRA